MSRFHEWTSKESGLIHWIRLQGYQIDVRCQKGRTDMFAAIEIKKIVSKYSKFAKINGSHSERILQIDFRSFCHWFKSKDWPKYSPTLTK